LTEIEGLSPAEGKTSFLAARVVAAGDRRAPKSIEV